MLKVIYQTYNEEELVGKPFEKEFKDRAEMNAYDLSQMGHPFLSLKTISVSEV